MSLEVEYARALLEYSQALTPEAEDTRETALVTLTRAVSAQADAMEEQRGALLAAVEKMPGDTSAQALTALTQEISTQRKALISLVAKLPESESAKAVAKIAQDMSKHSTAMAEQMQTLTVQRDALLSFVRSNQALTQAVIAKLEHVNPVAEEWNFEHVYDRDGDIKQTIAKRIK